LITFFSSFLWVGLTKNTWMFNTRKQSLFCIKEKRNHLRCMHGVTEFHKCIVRVDKIWRWMPNRLLHKIIGPQRERDNRGCSMPFDKCPTLQSDFAGIQIGRHCRCSMYIVRAISWDVILFALWKLPGQYLSSITTKIKEPVRGDLLFYN
jgi:hypothetical protein